MLLADQRAEVVRACRQLVTTGLVRGTSGNVSVREPESGAIAITPTGLAYTSLRPADLPVLAASGERLDGALAPTSELALHLGIYRARPDVGAIVHTHSMFATTFAVLGEPIPMVHYLLARAGRQSPYRWRPMPATAPRNWPTPASGRSATAARCCWPITGVVAVGADLDAAMAIAEAVEYTAELAWRARQLGQPRQLDEAQCGRGCRGIRQLRPAAARLSRTNPGSLSGSGLAEQWRQREQHHRRPADVGEDRREHAAGGPPLQAPAPARPWPRRTPASGCRWRRWPARTPWSRSAPDAGHRSRHTARPERRSPR